MKELNHLDRIYKEKIECVERYKKLYTTKNLEKKISSYKNYYDFKKPLTNKKKINIIAEIKKASPSAGEIIKDYKPTEIAKKYAQAGAACLSVLTEEKNFKGKIEHIAEVKKEVKLPVLCKDFIYDYYQLYLARAFGADAVLLILSRIGDVEAYKMKMIADTLGLSVIFEVHETIEARQVFRDDDVIVGINNRNLKTLETDIENTYRLYEYGDLKKRSGPMICESGIKSEKEVEEILKKTGINNFLIGESLLKGLDKKSSLLSKITQITL